ncbi:MAG: DUF4349 domain-containing protein [Firmicutes bacterium]|nr:DUF4349 domain-containing protein [Bacillota bacterium]
MTCQEIRDQLSAYMDKMLPTAQMRVIAEHLSLCPHCRGELQQLEETVALLRQVGEVEPPPDLTDAIMDKIQTVAQEDKGAAPIWRRFQNRKYYGGLIAAAACLLIAAIIVGRGLPSFKMAADGGLSEGITEDVGDYNALSLPRIAPGDMRLEMDAVEEEGKDFTPARAFGEKRMARMVSKEAHLTLLVEDVDREFDRVVFLVEGAGGFVQNSGTWEKGKQRVSNLTLRVPVDRFSDILAQLAELGQVEGRELGGQDVTMEYVDTEARLRNLKRQEERFLDILQRADTVEDILQVEGELERVRGEIEALTAHLKNLDDLVGLSTIDMELRQLKVSARRIAPPSLAGVMTAALKASISTFNDILYFFATAIVIGGGIIPFLPFLLLAYLGYGWYKKKRAGEGK